MTPVVSLRGASLAFGKRTLWEDLDLDINPGEFFAVLGPNGSGKTTFLKVLLGLQELNSGTAVLGRPSRGAGQPPDRLHPAAEIVRPRTRPCAPGTSWASASTATAGASASAPQK